MIADLEITQVRRAARHPLGNEHSFAVCAHFYSDPDAFTLERCIQLIELRRRQIIGAFVECIAGAAAHFEHDQARLQAKALLRGQRNFAGQVLRVGRLANLFVQPNCPQLRLKIVYSFGR